MDGRRGGSARSWTKRRLSLLLLANAVALIVVVPLTFVLAYAVTDGLTGWTSPGAGIVQGCETSLACSEGGVYFTVLAFLMIGVVCGFLVFNALTVRAWRKGWPTPSPVRFLRRQYRRERDGWNEMRSGGR